MSSNNQRFSTRYSDPDILRGHNEIAAKYEKDPQSMRMSVPMIERHLDRQRNDQGLPVPVAVQSGPRAPTQPVRKPGVLSRLFGNAAKLATTAATTAATNAVTNNMTPEESNKIMECRNILAAKGRSTIAMRGGGKRKTHRKGKKSKRHNKKHHNKTTRKVHKKKHIKKH